MLDHSTARPVHNDPARWYLAMVGCALTLPTDERRALEEWERANLGALATSDWPGWEKYIGPCPTADRPTPPKTKKAKIDHRLRQKVYERDAYRCQACGSWHDLTLDHIVPEARGGATTFDNLRVLCRQCNSRKGTKDA